MKILITGASGFIGGAFWRRCQELGWEIRAIGRRPLKATGYLSHDLSQPLELDFQPDVVLHAAARSSPWGRRREFIAQNVVATRNVIRFCEDHGRPHLIQLSTSAVLYRNEHQIDLEESAPPPRKPINEYARTKLEAERCVESYRGPWCILRPRAVFGPGDTVVFPRILAAARRGRFPLIQTDQPAWADLIYIGTLVEYMIRTAERRAQGIYHLTNGSPVRLLETLGEIFQRLGLPPPQRKMSVTQANLIAGALELTCRALPFLGEPPLTRFGVSVFAYSKTLSPAKTHRDLGPPAISLEEGIDAFVAWQKPLLKTAL